MAEFEEDYVCENQIEIEEWLWETGAYMNVPETDEKEGENDEM